MQYAAKGHKVFSFSGGPEEEEMLQLHAVIKEPRDIPQTLCHHNYFRIDSRARSRKKNKMPMGKLGQSRDWVNILLGKLKAQGAVVMPGAVL